MQIPLPDVPQLYAHPPKGSPASFSFARKTDLCFCAATSEDGYLAQTIESHCYRDHRRSCGNLFYLWAKLYDWRPEDQRYCRRVTRRHGGDSRRCKCCRFGKGCKNHPKRFVQPFCRWQLCLYCRCRNQWCRADYPCYCPEERRRWGLGRGRIIPLPRSAVSFQPQP
jgi:hypothetical protein